MKKDNLLGCVFTYWTVFKEASPDRFGHIRWVCQCKCGNEKIVSATHLKTGKSQSCGCFKIEKITKHSPKISSARDVWRQNYKDLLFEDFYILSQLPCYYCGIAPHNNYNVFTLKKGASQKSIGGGQFTYNGLDRLDSTKGHVIDNVVPCCKWCNFAKRERTIVQFNEWIDRLISFRVNNKIIPIEIYQQILGEE